jgi:hypothetical protein
VSRALDLLDSQGLPPAGRGALVDVNALKLQIRTTVRKKDLGRFGFPGNLGGQ